MDWTSRSGSSHHGKIDHDKMPIESGEMGSWKTGECGDQILVCVDEFGKIESEMGIAL